MLPFFFSCIFFLMIFSSMLILHTTILSNLRFLLLHISIFFSDIHARRVCSHTSFFSCYIYFHLRACSCVLLFSPHIFLTIYSSLQSYTYRDYIHQYYIAGLSLLVVFFCVIKIISSLISLMI